MELDSPDNIGRFVHILFLLNLFEDIPEYANESAQDSDDVNEVGDSGKVDQGRRNGDLGAKAHIAPSNLGNGRKELDYRMEKTLG